MNESLSIEAALEKVRHHPKMVIAEDYELVYQSGAIRNAQFENGSLNCETRDRKIWLSLRVMHRKQVGTALSSVCTPEGIHSLVERAFEASECTAVDPWFRFPIWRGERKSPKRKFEEFNLFGSDLPFLNSVWKDLVAQPLSLEEKYETQWVSTTIIRKTEKQVLEQQRQINQAAFALTLKGRDELCRISESRSFEGEGQELIATKLRWIDKLMRKGQRFHLPLSPKDPMPGGKVVIDSAVMARLLETLAPHFYGSSAMQSAQKLNEKVDKKIFPESVSIVDEGITESIPHTTCFDLEGVPLQRTVLVDKGIFKSFLHDTISGARFNRTSTGNLVKNFLSQNLWGKGVNGKSEIGPTRLHILPSDRTLLNLIETMGSGFYLESIANQILGANEKGTVNLMANGWIVSKGDPVQPVCNIPLCLDPFKLVEAIDLTANDLDYYGLCGAPSVFINKIPLSDVCG